MATDERSFGYLLRRYRLAALLTQEQLAERAHLSYGTISDLERGAKHTPRRDTVLLLADALELSPQERATLIAAAHPVDRVPRSRVCPSCGASLPLTQTFCGECGTPFEPGRPSAALPAPIPAPPPEPHPMSLAPAPASLTTHQVAPSPAAPPAEERRLVTALFCDLVGFTPLFERLDPEEVREIQGAYFSAMSTHITRYGGTVEKYAGDAVLALFRVPTAHEDDPERAVLCALAMQQAIGPLADSVQRQHGVGVAIRVGIDTGEVVAGSWDVTDRQEVAVTGHALNTAARLEAAAEPGEVLVGAQTVRLTRRIQYGEERPLALKGISEPVRGYPALGIAEQVGERWETIQRATPLIGRERELAQLLELWERVRGGEGQLLTVIGEPGVGKSRLLSEGIEQIKERSTDVRLVRGRCLSYGQNISLWLIADLVRSLVGVREADGPDRVREAVTSTLDDLLNDCDAEDRREAIDVLGEVVGLAAGGSMVAQAGPQVRRAALIRSLRRVLGALTDRAPVVLVLEDLHWIDEASQEVIGDVLVDVPGLRMLVLAAQRQGWQAPWSEWSWTERISLRPLGERDAAMLADAVLNRGVSSMRPTPDLLAYLGDRAGGNPFFVEELVRALQEAGGLQQQDDGISLKEAAAEKLPATLTEVILARLDRLEPRVKRVAQVGSVIGRSFAVRLLAQVMEENQAALELPLTALQQAELAFPRRGRELEYVFKHVTVQEVAYGMLVQKRRKQLHLQTARAIASLYPSDEYVEIIAYHFNRTDEHAEAARWLEKAGDRAAIIYGNESAIDNYQEARRRLELSGAEPTALARLDEKLGGVLSTIGRYDEALAVLERSLKVYRQARDLEAAGGVMAQLGLTHRHRGTTQEGIAQLQPMLEMLTWSGPSPGLAALHISLAELFQAAGRYREGLEAAGRASELARAIGDDRLLADAGQRRSQGLALLGQVEEARRVLEEVIPLAEAVGDLNTLRLAVGNLGEAYMHLGNLDAAGRYKERWLEVAQRVGDPNLTAFALTNLGEILIYLGEWEGAQLHLEQAAEMLRPLGSSWYAAYPPLILGRLRLWQGEWEEASRLLGETVAIAGLGEDRQALEQAQLGLAEIDLLEGRPEAALARLEPLASDEDATLPLLLPVLALVHLDLREHDRAAEMAAEAVRLATEQHDRLRLVDALWVQGMVLARQERWDEARRVLDEGLELARLMPYPYAEARILYQDSMVHLQQGEPEQARARLEEALTTFQRLGAKKDVERTEEMLGRR